MGLIAMPYALLTDALIVFHFLFVGFVIFGGVVVLRWHRAAFIHLPAAAWGVFIEWSGFLCPLTPLENYLRQQAGLDVYQGGFVDHYIMPVLYPAGLTRDTQMVLGALILVINVSLYAIAFTRDSRRKKTETFGAITHS